MYTKASSNEFLPCKIHSTIKVGACKKYMLKLAQKLTRVKNNVENPAYN